MVQSMKPWLAVQCLGWIVCPLQDLTVGELLCVWEVRGTGENYATKRHQARWAMNVSNDMTSILIECFEIPNIGRRIDHLPCQSILCFVEDSANRTNEISPLEYNQPVVVMEVSHVTFLCLNFAKGRNCAERAARGIENLMLPI